VVEGNERADGLGSEERRTTNEGRARCRQIMKEMFDRRSGDMGGTSSAGSQSIVEQREYHDSV
jgi:hypothetical protein